MTTLGRLLAAAWLVVIAAGRFSAKGKRGDFT
jgi:hypothetical protein